jgi:hypothetical protein
LHSVTIASGRLPAPLGAAVALPVVLTTGGLSHRPALSPEGAAVARSIAPAGAKQDALDVSAANCILKDRMFRAIRITFSHCPSLYK